MKKKDLEKVLAGLGWEFQRHGGSHDVWTDGEHSEFIPRHKEINEILAKAIIKRVKNWSKS